MKEAWRELKVGDQVRIVRVPTELTTSPDEEFKDVYRGLINAGTVLTIQEINEYGKPWVSWEEGKGRTWRAQSLALNDDSWERWSGTEKR